MKITQSKSALFLGILLFIGSALDATSAVRVVTNTSDSGPGSLRQAVLEANAAATPDTIVFDSSFNTARTITLATVIAISPTTAVKTLTITGPGAALLTISGNNATRIFTTETRDTVAISGMTLTRGNGNNGGAISNLGFLTLTNVNFTANVTNSGGGIYNAGNGTIGGVLRIEGCVFTNNQTTGTNINGDGGSALESNSGNVTINNSIMTGGTTRGGGGAIRNNGTMAITNSTISNNTSGGAGNSDGGGAILNSGSGTMTLTNSTIMNNTAGENTAGGGIVNSFHLTIVNSTITGNTATEQGGGIYAGGSGVSGEFVNITNSIISNNVANTGTGATTFGNGGGIWIQGGMTTTIVGSTISGNTATAIPGGSVTRQGNGGGIYTDGPLTLKNSTVSGNFAGNSYGGIQDSNPGGSGDVVTLINSTITNNTAQGNVGGFGVSSVSDAGQQAVRNTIIARNIANGGTSPDVFGSITSEGYNLIGNATGATFPGTATGNVYNVDPLLGPLASNGGPTQTHALMVGSPAIDQGKSADFMSDQRGLPRPHDNASIPNASGGDGSDIGAFEDQPPNTPSGNNITPHAPSDDARVTFPSVSQGGFTTFIPIEPPSLAGTPPQGYTILDNAPAYNITTTATFTSPIIVGFTVASITSPAEFARVRILCSENGQLVDRTILAPDSPPPDFATRSVFARVDSLSSFVVALAPAAQLLNVSTRLRVQTGDNVLIGGFIISGTASKRVIVRAIGPSLTDFGIAGALADPVLELNGPAGFAPVTNNDWRDTQQAEIEATGIPPSNDLESAIVATLAPGAYTAVVRGQNGGTGIGLVETYDLEAAVDAKLANISTRGFVEAGENVMIGGFIAQGNASGQMLVRAIGPSLLAFGVANALQDPTLELRDGSGALVASNDDWVDTQQTAIEATGIPPTHNKESAILSTLAPGIYTAIVRGVGDTTGVGLVEVYNLN